MKNVMTYRMIWKFLNFNNDTHKDSLVTHKPKMLQYLGYKVLGEMTMKKSLCGWEREEDINIKVSSVNGYCYHRTISLL